MSDPGQARPLTGWQRAHVLSAVEYVRDVALKAPRDERARAVYERLLEVLEPTRRIARQHREQRQAKTAAGSMWDQRSGHERRLGDRRKIDAWPLVPEERRRTQRRSGVDRRNA
jgi:hypothetical protein